MPGPQEGRPQKGEEEQGVGEKKEPGPGKPSKPFLQEEVEGQGKPAQKGRKLLGVQGQGAPEVAPGPGHAASQAQGGRQVSRPQVPQLQAPQAPEGGAPHRLLRGAAKAQVLEGAHHPCPHPHGQGQVGHQESPPVEEAEGKGMRPPGMGQGLESEEPQEKGEEEEVPP